MKKALFSALLGSCALITFFVGCRSSMPNQNPVGKVFPTASGETLAGDPMTIPADLPAGGPTVLLVGYVQDTQFDVDRWLIGLLQAKISVPFFEVPTIKGWAPTLFANKIDQGMRNGIPEEDHGVVLTIYGDDAADIVEMTGNENPRNTRVFLLDAEGQVVWFHDRGFSAGKLLELVEVAESL